MKRWLAFIVTLLLFCLPVYAEEGTALSLDSSPASNGLAEIAVVFGEAFYMNGYLRISYANSMENIQEALRRMAEALKKLGRE